MEAPKQKAHYEKDLKLTAYLLALAPEITFLGTERDDNQIVFFLFGPVDKIQEKITNYYTDAPISAQKLFNCLDRARDILTRAKSNWRGNFG